MQYEWKTNGIIFQCCDQSQWTVSIQSSLIQYQYINMNWKKYHQLMMIYRRVKNDYINRLLHNQ